MPFGAVDNQRGFKIQKFVEESFESSFSDVTFLLSLDQEMYIYKNTAYKIVDFLRDLGGLYVAVTLIAGALIQILCMRRL